MESETLGCWKQQCFALFLLQKQNDGGAYGLIALLLLLLLLQGTDMSETSGPEIPSRGFPATSLLLLSLPSAQNSCEALIKAATAIVSGATAAGAADHVKRIVELLLLML